jgi:type II secretory pathway pseudopilin PulG
MSNYLVWLILAALIIVVLTVVAARLLWRLRQQTQKEKAALEVAERESLVEQLDAQSGIGILARCYLGGQLGASEFALRVAVLTETAALDPAYSKDTKVFTEMAAALAHIPTHQAWKGLTAEQRAHFGAEMALLEGKYSDRVRAAAEALVD